MMRIDLAWFLYGFSNLSTNGFSQKLTTTFGVVTPRAPILIKDKMKVVRAKAES